MEGNKANFFSLNRPEHWERRGISRNLDAAADGVSLRRGEKYALQDLIGMEELDEVGHVTAFAVGPFGHMALLNDRGDLWRYDRGSRLCERLFISGHGLFSASGKLAITGDSLFIADRSPQTGEARPAVGAPPPGEPGQAETAAQAGGATLAAFDMASGQLRWRRSGEQIEGLPFCPLAIASDDRCLYVLTLRDAIDRSDDPFIESERHLAIIKIALSGGIETVMTDDAFRVRLSAFPDEWEGIVYLHASPEGGVHAFDSRACRVFHFDASGRLLRTLDLPPQSYAGLAVDSRGRLYAGESRYVLDGMEDDRFVHHFDANGRPLGAVGGYRGKADSLTIDARDRLYILNGESRTITVLGLQQRTRGWEETGGAPEGIWLSRAFDSAEAETVWHKFTLDADIPDGTMLRLSYFSSDTDRMPIAGSLWSVNDWLARTDHDFADKLAALAPLWSPPVVNPADALFFGARGRYLWLRVEWLGSENATPTIRRMRVHFPRETLLNYLPSVYREEAGSRDFLERYLALFGTLFDSVESRIDDMAAQFDPGIVQGRQLRWLASWLGLTCDDHWSDDWVRRLIRAAPMLYRYRGTRRGIETLIETLTGRKPIIVEAFQFKQMREQGELRWLTDDLYGDNPFVFTLLLHQNQARSDKERVLLRQLVEDHKPAYTQVQILWLQPWMYLDLHTYLGVNTMLAEPSLFSLEADRSMPNDTLIVDRDMDKRMDAHTRLGMDSELE